MKLLHYVWDICCLAVGFLLFCPLWLRDRRLRKQNVVHNGESQRLDGKSIRSRISVIIPARNEAENLQVLLQLLKNQTMQPNELIVVDDGSEDGTSSTAAACGAAVIIAPPLPPGWIGKSWACWNGALKAKGDLLLFLDADTRPSSEFIEQMMSHIRQAEGLITVQPSHAVPTSREQWSAFFNLVITAGSGASSAIPIRSAGFGPCAACSRDHYMATGGHEAVRSDVLEHLQLGKRFKANGLQSCLMLGKESLQFRMYPKGWSSLIQGWSKSIGLGAGSTPIIALLLVIIWFSGLAAAAIRLLSQIGGESIGKLLLAAAIYALAVATVSRGLRESGTFKWYTKLFYPVYMLFFIVLFSYSLILSFIVRKVSWKGRQINVP
nr:glycosyltransferase [Paenibacillus castaneae]